uniref:Uncharacterized protein n=1 Tax=Acrobeloides nanus TaxID=290746 RepID=A0A914EDI3_9BILA
MTMSSSVEEEYRRTQEERRDHVKNLKLEYEFGCFEERRPESCQFLGEYRESIEQKFKEAYELFRNNCETFKYPKSCWKEAQYLLAGGHGIKTDVNKAIQKLDLACNDAKEPMKQSCRLLARVYYYGDENRPAESEKAEHFMKRACELEDWEGCWCLSVMYMSQDQKFLGKRHKIKDPQKEKKAKYRGSLPVDMQKALHYGILACDNNVVESCFNVQRMYYLGDGIPRDLDKAKEYMDKGVQLLKIAKSQESVQPFVGISNQ